MNSLRLLSALLAAGLVYGAAPERYFEAIRTNNLVSLRQLIDDGGKPPADARGMTPLHYAALYGSVDAMRMLLENTDADVNARTQWGGTPLLLGASSNEKIKLLLAAGADPRIASGIGRTPLMIAARRHGSADAVKMLVEAGADVHATDVRGTTALIEASGFGDIATVKMLLAKGAKPGQADKGGLTPLMSAMQQGEPERVKLFLDLGVDVKAANTFGGMVKTGPIALTGLTALHLAAPHASPEVVKALLEAGAPVNGVDGRGLTPLMAAMATDHGYDATVKMLTERSDASKSMTAAKATSTATMNAEPRDPATAVDQAMKLLTRASAEFFNQSGCSGCHHQPITARANAALRAYGVTAHPAAEAEQVRAIKAFAPMEAQWAQMMDLGGDIDTLTNTLLGAAASRMPASSFTDTAVNYLAARQHPDGSWKWDAIGRAPMEDGAITRTASTLRALQLYGWEARQAEFDERIARAKQWLLQAKARTTYERAEQLMGLAWAGVPPAQLREIRAALIAEQRNDGGWAQTPGMASDAYATGLAMAALAQTGMAAGDKVYAMGVKYLLATQQADGSWYVRSRAPKFQPYFESGFPHGHDQWISSASTAWAVMALAPAAVGAPVEARTE